MTFPQNNHIGQAGLGMMYLNGLGIDKVYIILSLKTI